MDLGPVQDANRENQGVASVVRRHAPAWPCPAERDLPQLGARNKWVHQGMHRWLCQASRTATILRADDCASFDEKVSTLDAARVARIVKRRIMIYISGVGVSFCVDHDLEAHVLLFVGSRTQWCRVSIIGKFEGCAAQ